IEQPSWRPIVLHQEVPLPFGRRAAAVFQQLKGATLELETDLSLVRVLELRAIELGDEPPIHDQMSTEPNAVVFVVYVPEAAEALNAVDVVSDGAERRLWQGTRH